MKSNLISKSETAEILDKVSKQWKIDLPKIKNLKCHYLDDDSMIITSHGFKVLKKDDDFIPFLSETQLLEKFPYVIVDMGAVKFMCNGANVMRPGITKFAEFEKNDVVCVKEESQNKFLAVGKSIVTSKDAKLMQKGEVLKNLHYVSDKYWEVGKEISG